MKKEKVVQKRRFCYLGPSITRILPGANTHFIRGAVFIVEDKASLTAGMDPEAGAAISDMIVPSDDVSVTLKEIRDGSPVWSERYRRLGEVLGNKK